MKKILLLASYKDSLVNFRGDLIGALCAKGFEVHAMAPGLDEDDATSQELRRLGAQTHPVSMDRTGLNPLRDTGTILDLVRRIRSIAPDTLLCYTIKPVMYGMLAGRMAGVPTRVALITGLGAALGGAASLKQRLGFWLHKLALRRAAAVIFQNDDDRAFFKRHALIGPSIRTALVSGSGVNLDRFAVEPVETRRITFLMVARWIKAKGVVEFGEVAGRIRADHPDTAFRLIGWREDSPDFVEQEVLDRWEAAGDVVLVGKLKDVREELRGASVLVLPSGYPEGIPRSLLEGLAVGLPIITTDRPGCREVVQANRNGLLVEPGSTDSLEEACRWMIDNREKLPAMGLASRAFAEERFDVTLINRDMIDLIEKVRAENA